MSFRIDVEDAEATITASRDKLTLTCYVMDGAYRIDFRNGSSQKQRDIALSDLERQRLFGSITGLLVPDGDIDLCPSGRGARVVFAFTAPDGSGSYSTYMFGQPRSKEIHDRLKRFWHSNVEYVRSSGALGLFERRHLAHLR